MVTDEPTRKRKNDSNSPPVLQKKLKLTENSTQNPPSTLDIPPQPETGESSQHDSGDVHETRKDKGKRKKNEKSQSTRQTSHQRIKKLKPARPFPTVPASVSQTGPRSAHREGKNMICITRKTSLGAYMRRCKNVIINDGYITPSSILAHLTTASRYKMLHFSAMGAAIPLLLQLVCALPPILPFPQDEIHWEVTTGTVEVQDEIIPDDEDEDLSYQTRSKSNLAIIFKIGDGEFEGDRGPVRRYSAGKSVPKSFNSPKNEEGKEDKKGKAKTNTTEIIFEEPEQDLMDML